MPWGAWFPPSRGGCVSGRAGRRLAASLFDSLRDPTVNVNVPGATAAGGRSGGGTKRSRTEQDLFAREAERIADRIVALKREAEAAGLAAEAAARLQAAYKLEEAARADGLGISREEQAIIDELVDGYARATSEKERATQAARDLAEADREAKREMEELKRAADDLGQGVGDALGGLIAGTRDWRAALGEVLQTVLRITETRLGDSGFFDQAGSGIASGIGGFFSSLFGGLFADGAAFRHGRVVPFATGGLVTGPTFFRWPAGAWA